MRVLWQGEVSLGSIVDGGHYAALALVRYVRLHGPCVTEHAIAAELWFMGNHFRFKTGCEIYVPQLKEHPSTWIKMRPKALEIGQGVLINMVSP